MDDLLAKARDLVNQCKYKEAIECFKETLLVATDDITTMINIEMAHVYVYIEQFDTAMGIYTSCRDSAFKNNSDANLFMSLMGIGNIYHAQQKFNEALSVYELASRIPHSVNRAYYHRIRATTLLAMGCNNAAKDQLNLATNIVKYGIEQGRYFRIKGRIEHATWNNLCAWVYYCDAFMRMVNFRKGSYQNDETCGVLFDMVTLMLRKKKYRDDAMFLLRQVYIVWVRTFGPHGHSKIEKVVKLFGDTVLPTEKNPVELADVLAIIQTVDMRDEPCCNFQ